MLGGRSEIKNTCYVAITADRGLCGGYNSGVQRSTEGEVKADVLAGRDYMIVPVGRKAEGYFRFRGYHLGKPFNGFSDQPTYDDAKAIGEYVVDLYASGEVDKVELVYTRFISSGTQEVVLRPLVPLTDDTVTGGDGRAGQHRRFRRRLRVRARPDRRSSTRSCPATSRPASTPRCSTPRRPNTPSASGR